MIRCNGELDAEQLRGRANISARNKGGVWVLDSHEPPQNYRSGKRTGDKR